jgi:hypothetical protein
MMNPNEAFNYVESQYDILVAMHVCQEMNGESLTLGEVSVLAQTSSGKDLVVKANDPKEGTSHHHLLPHNHQPTQH